MSHPTNDERRCQGGRGHQANARRIPVESSAGHDVLHFHSRRKGWPRTRSHGPGFVCSERARDQSSRRKRRRRCRQRRLISRATTSAPSPTHPDAGTILPWDRSVRWSPRRVARVTIKGDSLPSGSSFPFQRPGCRCSVRASAPLRMTVRIRLCATGEPARNEGTQMGVNKNICMFSAPSGL